MNAATLLLLASALLCAAADPARDARWIADLDYLAQQLPQRHPNFFSVVPRAGFDAAVDDTRRSIPDSTDAGIMIRFAAITALGRDSHTNLFLTQRQNDFRVLPLAFRWFDDGLYVVASGSGHESALGAKVTAIGDRTPEEAFERVKAIISYENDHHAREVSQSYLVYADVLEALGIVSDASTVRLEIERAPGERHTLTVTPAERGASTPLRRMPDTAAGFVPLYQRNLSREYWFTYLENARTLYFAYNLCRNNPSQPFARFNDELWSFFDTHEVDRVIIDLRNNPGGDSSVIQPFLQSGLQRAARFERVRPYVLIGRQTHSSAMMNATQLSGGPVRLIGQPTGGSPNSFGEVQTFTLPNSQLLVRHSTRYFTISSRFPSQTVPPDVYVPFLSTDYFSRHDPVLAAALAETESSGGGPQPDSAVTAVSAATFRSGEPVAPDSLVALFGNFGDAQDVSVLVAGAGARVLATFATQINVVLPAGLEPGVAPLRVLAAEREIAAGSVRVAAAAPGLFAPAVRDADGLVHVFATGLGGSPVRAFAGADESPIDSVVATGTPGLYDIRFSAATTQEVPVFVVAGKHASNAVLIR
jgi:hypothetical protein